MNRILIYDAGSKTIKSIDMYSLDADLKISGSMAWIDMENPTPEEISYLKDTLHLHPLLVEHSNEKSADTKFRVSENYVFAKINGVEKKEKRREVYYPQLSAFLNERFLVTVHKEKSSSVDTIFGKAKSSAEYFDEGIDYILYCVADKIMDKYHDFADEIEGIVSSVEEKIMGSMDIDVQRDILSIKRTTLRFKRHVSSNRTVIDEMMHLDHKFIKKANEVYFLEIYEHILKIIDSVEILQDLIMSLLDLYMAQVSNKTNHIMKILTIFTTILMPLTLITGIYGMNFSNMPELGTKYGYFAVLGVMAVITIIQIIYFKKKKWY